MITVSRASGSCLKFMKIYSVFRIPFPPESYSVISASFNTKNGMNELQIAK